MVSKQNSNDTAPKLKTIHTPLLSLFCGCGGLDQGFHDAGFWTSLAYDKRKDSLSSWKRSFPTGCSHQRDISNLTVEQLDNDFGRKFEPLGVIGGPPCQGFSLANRFGGMHDPRNALVHRFFDIALSLHERSKLHFIVMENVPALAGKRGRDILTKEIERLEHQDFFVSVVKMNAADYGVPQARHRLFLVALSKHVASQTWEAPAKADQHMTVRDAIGSLPEPTHFRRNLSKEEIVFHPNHWCMAPKSPKFTSGELTQGFVAKRSFKTLKWDEPSYTASYGNREVHIHPDCKRRLSVYEAMLLQGFPETWNLAGSLSSQIQQVSEAVPPPLAKAVAESVIKQLGLAHPAVETAA